MHTLRYVYLILVFRIWADHVCLNLTLQPQTLFRCFRGFRCKVCCACVYSKLKFIFHLTTDDTHTDAYTHTFFFRVSFYVIFSLHALTINTPIYFAFFTQTIFSLSEEVYDFVSCRDLWPLTPQEVAAKVELGHLTV